MAEPEHTARPAPAAPDAAGAAVESDDGGVFFVSLQYRGTAYRVPVQPEDAVATIFDFVQEALDFPREYCKLIFRGKMFRPDHEDVTVSSARLVDGAKLMLIANSARDVEFVQSSRADPLVKGFAELERDEISRRRRARAAGASAWGTKQDGEYKFNSIKAEFKYSDPPPFEAEKLLQRLATDPGIIDIMKSRRFQVGILTEMSPQEAQERMAQRGTPNVDLLGYNQNSGEKIVLRLRTDNLKGFRPYHDLINTLIHEMTHNVWGPHDHNFWQLYGELKAQYMKFHRFWSHGGRAADSASVGQFQGFEGSGDDGEGGKAAGGFGEVLGGASSGTSAAPRTLAARAAAARMAMGSGPDEPPRPNFLAGNGTWVFMCPCGQVHDPAECEIGRAAPSSATSATQAPAAPAPAEPAPAAPAAPVGPLGGAAEASRPAEPAPHPAPAAAPPRQLEADVAMEAPAPEVASGTASTPRRAVADAPAHQAEADVVMEGAAPEAPDESIADVDPAGAEPAGPSGAASAADAMDLEPALDLAELEAQGLGGASVWISGFSNKLRTLRGGASQSTVELLLKLVRNVVNNPSDPKFRRIRADNPKIRTGLLSAGEAAETLMRMLGFEPVEDGSARVFVLREAALDTARLLMGKELLEMELKGVTVAGAA